jgi:hypothetical protein
VCRKIVVEVARIIRNLGSCPTRQFDFILGIRNFDFGDDQPIVITVKNVDLPGPAGENLAVPRLLDERSFAKLIQHHRRVGKRNRVLEFKPAHPGRGPLDGEKATVPGNAHAHDALVNRRQITLPIERSSGHGSPPRHVDEEFALDLLSHEVILLLLGDCE